MKLQELLDAYDKTVNDKELLVGGIRFDKDNKKAKFELITKTDAEVATQLKQIQWETKYIAISKFRDDHEDKFTKTELKLLDKYIANQKRDNKKMMMEAQEDGVTLEELDREHKNSTGVSDLQIGIKKRICDRCGGELKDTGIVLTSNPLQYQYECEQCRNIVNL